MGLNDREAVPYSSLNTLSRSKGIETFINPTVSGSANAMLARSLNTLSRSKGIETALKERVVVKQPRLNTLSRSKGIETSSATWTAILSRV